VDELILGSTVLTFDGRVVEYFDNFEHTSSLRLHVAQLTIAVGTPGLDGSIEVTMASNGRPWIDLMVASGDVGAVHAFCDKVQAASPSP
jgi:hypothetical protein